MFDRSISIFWSISIADNASLLALYICATTHGPHFTKLLSRALFFWPCQCTYKFIPCLAFRVHVAGDLNKTIVRSRRSLDFVRSRFTRGHPFEPELPYAIKCFSKHNSYRTECFWICILHWIWSPIQWTVPISRIISNDRQIVQQLGLIWMSLVYAVGLWSQARNNFAWPELEAKNFLDGGTGAEIWFPVPQK